MNRRLLPPVLASIAALVFAVALFAGFQSIIASRNDARAEAADAKRAAEAAQMSNIHLEVQLACQSRQSDLSRALDVAVASILLKVTAGNPVDLTPEREALQEAMDQRAKTTETCG